MTAPSDPITQLRSELAERYAVQHELGVGGMATVYLAEDLRHRRQVAIKVLQPELAAVVGVERFLTEIEVTAKLHHPHILPLFDSGSAGMLPYYVMPYVPGETLRERLRRERHLPLDECIGIASAVASALDYAHRNGVIHRDIKPANILLHEGQPLVADFGIALAVSAAGGQRLTKTGLSIGTPEYMSPEQAAGSGPVDARSDQYALACVVYEMLAGEPPHTGPTAQAVIAKVMSVEPRRVTVARETVPPYMEFAIHRALAKHSADRYPTVADFADALARPTQRMSWLGSLPALVGSSVTRRRVRWVGMALLVGAAAWGWLRPTSSPTDPVIRFSIAYPIGESYGAVRHAVAISPNGSHVAYVAAGGGEQRLYLRSLDQQEARALPGTDGALDPFFSPDGQWVGFATVVGLMKVPITGGPPIEIVDYPEPRGASWGENDTIYFGSTGGLRRVPATGGVVTQVSTLDAERGELLHNRPALLPGEEALLFTIGRGGNDETEIAVLSLPSGEVRTLLSGLTPRYVASGHLVYGRTDGVLMGAPFDPRRLEVIGPAVPLVNGVTVKTTATMDYAVSRNGTLSYLTGAASTRTVVIVDREGNEAPLVSTEGFYVSPRLSPNARRLAMGVGSPPTRQVWIYELTEGTLAPLTFEGHNYYPVWSPSGDHVVFSTETASSIDLRWIPSDGSGTAETLLANGEWNYPEVWSPDGRRLIYRVQDLTTQQRDLWVLTLDGEPTSHPLVQLPSSQEDAPAISPNGRWFAYASTQSGRYEIYVRGFPEPGARRQVSLNGGIEPAWSRNGREVFYWRGREFIAAAVEADSTFRVIDRTVLFERDHEAWPFHTNYDVFPDGERFVMLKRSDENSASLIVVVNWIEELRRLMANGS